MDVPPAVPILFTPVRLRSVVARSDVRIPFGHGDDAPYSWSELCADYSQRNRRHGAYLSFGRASPLCG